jgi:hypothetical protein
MAWPTLHVAELAGLDLAQVIASAIGEQDLAGAAWAPQWIGDELRQVRDAAWDAHLTGLGPAAEADAARRRGDHRKATQEQERARGYRVLEDAYRQSEVVFAATMADRAEWESATRQQRQLAVSTDADLRRRHPRQYFAPIAVGRTRARHRYPAHRAHADSGGGDPGDEPVDEGPGRRAPDLRRAAAEILPQAHEVA